jgi:putative nucleotidyltransferase with HDIG domain
MTQDEAFEVLGEVAAPARLVTHARLVLEAGDAILAAVASVGVTVDRDLVRAGAVLHDAGKARYPAELDGAGDRHEAEGERMLLARGVETKLARVCRSHAKWKDMECSAEELLVALADKLWKGARVAELEARVVDALAQRAGCDRWDLFVTLDDAFERVAAGADQRLARSRVSGA